MNADTVTCDFEAALLTSVQLQFSEAKIVGCLFHWKQALRRRLLQYNIDEDTISTLMCEDGLINLLTVVDPAEIVRKTIPYIRTHFDEKGYKKQFDSFWDYFTKYWLDKVDPEVRAFLNSFFSYNPLMPMFLKCLRSSIASIPILPPFLFSLTPFLPATDLERLPFQE
jgi:hypothetical protein